MSPSLTEHIQSSSTSKATTASVAVLVQHEALHSPGQARPVGVSHSRCVWVSHTSVVYHGGQQLLPSWQPQIVA